MVHNGQPFQHNGIDGFNEHGFADAGDEDGTVREEVALLAGDLTDRPDGEQHAAQVRRRRQGIRRRTDRDGVHHVSRRWAEHCNNKTMV